jgi:FkbM family methyltransferase
VNEEIISNAFSEHERRFGFTNMDGPTGRILSSDFIHSIKDIIDFNKVKVVLDIGSRDACQSLELARWFPNATVYAFEANPDALIWVEKNSALCNRVKVVPFAVSDVDGELSFYKVVNGNIGASSLYQVNHLRSFEWKQVETKVRSIRIDSWLIENGIEKVDIVWADVQGAESSVFNGFGKFLPSVDAIATEVAIEKLYDRSTLKSDLDEILCEFKCISQRAESTNTEVDAVYVNERLI